ncbi:hypothetical protein SAMN03097699_0943 [Flavobacteriaceae bacterium MAR_2010_188]|nr:hypothetical protein SAMN03097699_0943 [Flavobacteriaceae bacterium MAR_2010_188]
MKNLLFIFAQIVFVLPVLAQETVPDNNYLNITREGFGVHSAYDMNLGFVNGKPMTEGSAYFFKDWNTSGTVFIKDKGMVKLEKVNINLYDNTLEALYDETSVFTFNSENIIKIAIDDKVFRFLEINKEKKILELLYNDKFSVYKYNDVRYAKASKDPMRGRMSNKFITKEEYYLYKDGQLSELKLSKNGFSKMFQSESVSEDAIKDFISKNRLSLYEDEELLTALKFVSN